MKKRKLALAVILSLGCLLLSVLLSLALGSKRVSAADIWDVLLGMDKTSFQAAVIQARIPRTIFGIMAGGALGISGALMQSITRNPIADPSILGVNTGASLFVVCGMSFWGLNTAGQYIWLAIAGAAVTAVLVYGIASLGNGGATPLKLALAGSAAGTALASLVNAIMLPNSQVMDSFRFWQVGSIGAATWENIGLVLPFLIIGLALSIWIAPSLNALALGDEMAASLGVKTGLVRAVSALAGVVLCGAVTAIAGPVGFIGLMVPHLVRFLYGADMRLLLPFSALGGGCLLLFSDVIGRVIGSPGETEVGIVTAFIGAPVFIITICCPRSGQRIV